MKQDERLLILETNYTNVMDKLQEIVERFDKFEEKLDKALEKKANKWVEVAMYWGLTSVAIVAIGLIVRWIIYLEL